jgi:hypothetical protein
MKDRAHVLGTGVGPDGINRLGNAYRQNAARMEGLPSAGVVEAQITRNRVYLSPRACPHTVDGVLAPLEPGQSITRVARMALRHQSSQDKTGGRFRSNARLSAKLCRTIALAFETGGNGGIIGIDQFCVAPLLAVGQPGGLVPAGGMVVQRCGEGQGETLALALAQCAGLVEALLGLAGQGVDRLTKGQELVFRVAHQLDEDLSLTATAAAKTPHDLGEFLREAAGLALERGGPVTALRDDVVDECERFFVLSTA